MAFEGWPRVFGGLRLGLGGSGWLDKRPMETRRESEE